MSDPRPRTICCIVGARPNFVKIAPIMRALTDCDGLTPQLIHTGQHYDVAMNSIFFDELEIPRPDINLEVGSGSGTEQTARIMLGLEPILSTRPPDMAIVVGDVNSTLAAALVAAKLGIPLAHVEAGLRSGDRSMPEEVNRLVVDRLSDLLFASEQSAIDNLISEGVSPRRIVFVGNVMIDTLRACSTRAAPVRSTLSGAGADPALSEQAAALGFAFVTLHRPSNVDDSERLESLLNALARIARKITLVFALHPRTRAMIESAGLDALLLTSSIIVTPPLSYLRAIGLMKEARFVITDSGGVQEETTALGIPCLTVRDSTERPVTVQQGTNILVGTSIEALASAVDDTLAGGGKRGQIPPMWDGKAAERIVAAIDAHLGGRHALLPA